MTPGEETCGGRGSEWLTPRRRGINSSLKEKKKILKISRFSPFFSTLFDCSSFKFTTTTAQFPFYNCKLHFTTAQNNCHQLQVKNMSCLDLNDTCKLLQR